MREYGQVQCSFWTSADAKSMSHDARMLAVYLLTCPHSNGLGCYALPDGYVMADLKWPQETVSKGFAELSQTGFAKRCSATDFVLIPNFLRWNPISNPNVASARVKEFEVVSRKAEVFRELCESMLQHGAHWKPEFETLLKGFAEGLGKQDPTLPDPIQPEPTRSDPKRARTRDRKSGKQPDNPEFETAWSRYPKRAGGNPKSAALKAWQARIAAGVDPADLLAGVERYAAFCEATGKTDTEFVKQAATFFGPDKHYAEDWTPPRSNASGRSNGYETPHERLKRLNRDDGDDPFARPDEGAQGGGDASAVGPDGRDLRS